MAKAAKAETGGGGGPVRPAGGPPRPRPSLGEFVRQVRAETAKVVWPSRPDVVRTTILVLIMTTILAIFFLGVDQVLGRLVRLVLGLGG